MNDRAPSEHALSYRPAIDGLRSFAVLSVLLFHLDPAWLPGGFVGVDVFFVISGYLISSILLFELRGGGLGVARFYQRRIARIMPAFFAVALATVAAAWPIYLELDFASTGANLAAAALCVANMKLMLQGNYFTLSADAQPLMHYWSLAVEEQFYLVFPWLLFALRRASSRKRTALLALLAVLSCALCVALTWSRPLVAFYALPTRAWELLAGGLIASWTAAGAPGATPPALHGSLPLLGFATMLASFGLVHEAAGFPGYQALFPVLGTVLVLWPVTGSRSQPVERLLSLPALVSIGKLSYSLYLWHWPVFSLVDYALFQWPAPARVALKLGLTALLTWLGYRFVEAPARVYLNQPSHRRAGFVALAGCVALAVGVGVVVRRVHYANADDGARVFNREGRGGSVVLMGDSNGSMYGTTLRRLAERRDQRLTVLSVAAGDPLPHAPGGDGLWRSSLQYVRAQRPDVLILVCAWQGKLASGPARLEQALRALRPYVKRVVLVTQPPARPSAASRAELRNGSHGPWREPAEVTAARQPANAAVRALQGEGVVVIDVEDLFVVNGELRPFDRAGRELYLDGGHLSEHGAALVIDRVDRALRRDP